MRLVTVYPEITGLINISSRQQRKAPQGKNMDTYIDHVLYTMFVIAAWELLKKIIKI